MKRVLTLLLFITAFLNVNAQSFSTELLNKAKSGDADALYDLGECFYWGYGVQKSYTYAVECYRKAAEKGNKDAMYSMGACYQWGDGVEQNDNEAVFWYKKGADAGSMEAMFNLGVCYRSGIGVAEDQKAVFYWWEKSAELDYLPAMNNVGLCYRRGIGVEQDYKKAYMWYRKAALSCDSKSVNNLALCFQSGWGVDKNPVLAKALMVASNSSTDEQKKALKRMIIEETPDYEEQKTDMSNPPIIQIVPGSIVFADKSGNNAIDAGEVCNVSFKVQNKGRGSAFSCVAKVTATAQDINSEEKTIDEIKPGEILDITLPIKGGKYISDGSADLTVSVDEPNGCSSDPVILSVNTNAFVSPLLKVVDYAVSNESGSALKKMQPFNLQMIIQNTKHGMAENVSVSVELPDNVLLVDGKTSDTFQQLNGGDKKEMNLCIMATNKYKAAVIPVKVNIKEKYGKYAESRVIELSMNQQASVNRIVIDEIDRDKGDIEIAQIGGGMELSDVDRDIPHNKSDNTNTFAVVIANENYRQESKVNFAINDGTSFGRYCTEVLGMPEKNVRIVKDATLNEIRGAVNWLRKVGDAYKGDAGLIFYYAGHGVPDESEKDAYILPVDGYGNDLITAYKMDDLYSALSECPSRQTLVFLDACFSGKQRSGMEMTTARAVGVTPRKAEPKGNMIVFSAAEGDETAYPYEEKRHGLFTYFLLKKIKLTSGKVKLGELGDYVRDNVSKVSVINNSKSQTPNVQASSRLKKDWKNISLR